MDSKIRQEIRAAIGPIVDRLIFKKNGTCEARLTYFYRHGKSPDQLADRIRAAIPGTVVVETTDRWAAWPRVSYFRVVFKMEQVRDFIDRVEVAS